MLSARFKEYLLAQTNPPSKVTVKNYLSDINRFIRWLELKLNQPLDPQAINSQTIDQFKKDLLNTHSASSLERNLSSLRKFFYFLKLEGQISHSPFEPEASSQKPAADPWRIRDFKNHLYVFNAAHLTIKNYIIDVKQFINWAEQALQDPGSWETSSTNLISRMTPEIIEEYKKRLLNEIGLSPVSVNRKLSSLRKYFSWANSEGLLHEEIAVPNMRGVVSAGDPRRAPAVSIANEDVGRGRSETGPRAYSKLPPLRLLQKSKNSLVSLFDGLVIYPLVELKEKIDLLIWESHGRPVFEQAKQYIFNSLSSPASPSEAGRAKIYHPSSMLHRQIRNFPKSFYAPAKVSTKHFPIHKKAFYWYKRYQSYAIVPYFHMAILMLLFSVLGYAIYSNINPKAPQPKTLAALPTAPPRILSFQGRLTNAQGNPITTQTSLRMAIYNSSSASGSALLWQEVISPTPDEDGIFNVILGKGTAIPQSLFAENSALFLGVTVGQTPELKPRQQIATVAFAANAETLQGLPPITATSATSNVILALNSSGNLTIGGSASPVFQATGGNFTVSGKTLVLNSNIGSNGDIRIVPDGRGGIDVQKALKNTSNYGLVIPGAVEVHDLFVVLATSSSQAAFNINQNGTNNLITASASGIVRFFVGNSGAIYGGGNLEIDGNASDIAGTLNLSGSTLTSTSNLTINAAGYTRIGDSATPTTATGDDDLFVESDLEVGGVATIAGSLILYTSPIIQSTANQTLTLGGSTTGNITLSPNNGSDGIVNINAPTINTNTTSLALFDTTATTINFGGAVGSGGINFAGGSTSTGCSLAGDTGDLTCSGNILTTATTGLQGWWNVASGTIFPTNSTLDFLIGGQSSSAAKFAVLNINSGTPTASISANSGNIATYITGDGTLATTNRQSLTIGNSSTYNTTGNVLINSNGQGNVGIGTTNPGVTLDVFGPHLTGTGLARFKGSGTLGYISIDNTSPGSSGLIIKSAGTKVGQLDTDSQNVYLYNELFSASSPVIMGTNAGLVGVHTSSPLSNFDVRASSGTLSIASISGSTSFASLVVDNSGVGDLFTASSSGLNRFVIKQSGNVGIGTTSPTEKLTVSGGAGTSSLGIYGDANTNADLYLTETDNTAGALLRYNGSTNALSILTGTGGFTNKERLTVLRDTGLIGIGTTSPASELHVTRALSQGTTGKALAIFDQIESQDILTASAGGITKFTVANDGDITSAADTITASSLATFTTAATLGMASTTTLNLGTSAVINAGATALNLQADGVPDVNIAGGSGTTGCTIANSTGNLTCSGNIAGSSTGIQGYWQRASGALAPTNITDDLLLGATSTTSSKFAFLNVAGGTPTASISAGITGGIYLTALGKLATTSKQTITIGDGSSGLISFGSGVNSFSAVSNAIFTLNNANLNAANALTINDPGAGEGLGFNSTGSSWQIDVTDLNRGNVDGNLNLYGVAGSGANNSIAFWRPTMWVSDIGKIATASASSTGLNFTTSQSMNISFNPSGNVGIGLTNPASELQVTRALSAGVTGKALAIFDQIESQDILTASAGGVAKFTVQNDGDIVSTADTITASSLATFTTAATLGISATTLNLGAGSAATIGTTSNANLTLTPNGTGDLVFSTDADTTATFNGSAEGTANVTLTSGDLTITDGDLILSGGEISATADDSTGTSFSFTGVNTTGDTLGVVANSLTSGTALAVSSTATSFNGELLTLNKTGASGSTAFTSDIANITYSQTFDAGVGLNSTGNVLDVSRAITMSNSGNTHTISGAIVTIADSGTESAGDINNTSNVLSLAQNCGTGVTCSGAVFKISNSGTGADIALNNNETITNSTDGTIAFGADKLTLTSTTAVSGTLLASSYAAATTQTGALTGLSFDLSTNVTVPNSSSGNQTGLALTVKDGGASATAIGTSISGTADRGIDLSGLTISSGGSIIYNDTSSTIDLAATADNVLEITNSLGTTSNDNLITLEIDANTDASDKILLRVVSDVGGTEQTKFSVDSDGDVVAGNITIVTDLTCTDCLDFTDFEDTLDLDANLTLNQTTSTWSQTFTGDTTVGLTYTANSLTTGTALRLTSSGTITSGGELLDLVGNGITSGNLITGSATALTSGSLLSFAGPSGGTVGITGSLVSLTSDVGNAGKMLSSTATIDSTAGSASGYNLYASTTNSNTTNANSAYGVYSTLSDAIALGNSDYGVYSTVSNTAANTLGTKSVYGVYGTSSNTSTGVGGSAVTYGGYFSATGDSGGTSTAYGIYATATGADNNYAAIFDSGLVGIGNTAPLTALDVTGSASLSANLSLRGAATAHTFNILDNGTLNIQRSPGGDAGLATALFIQNNGNVGIGTTNPKINFHVVTSGTTTGLGSIPAGRGMAISGSAIGSDRLYFENTAATSGQRVFFIDNTSGNLSFSSVNDAASGFVTQNILNMLYNGNVGIGTGSPTSELHVTRPLSFGATGKALAIFDQIESQDILTASAGGITKFTVSNGGAASMSGSLTMIGANSIQTTSNTTLTIGGNTTGNIVLSPLNGAAGSLLTVNAITETLSGTTTLTASSLATFTTAATLGMASTTTLNLGSNATLTSSATALNLQADGVPDVNIAGGSGTTGCTIANATGDLTCSGNIAGASTGIQGYWQRASGALAPTNITDDLLLGATSTTSSKFAFLNVAGGTPTASISANSGNIATYITGDGNLQTTNGQTLTLGGITTGLININNKSGSAFTTFDTVNSRVGIGTTTPAIPLTVWGANSSTTNAPITVGEFIFMTTGAAANGIGGRLSLGAKNSAGNKGEAAAIAGVLTDVTSGLESGALVIQTRKNGGSFIERVRVDADGNVGIGLTTPVSELHVTRALSTGATGKALAIFDQIENQDILTASASGISKFTIDNTGAFTMAGTSITASSLATFTTAATLGMASTTTLNLGSNSTINSAATALNLQADGVPDVNIAGGSGTTGCSILNASGNLVCSGTMTSTAASGTLGYWNQTSGALFPGNSTVDLLVGATSTISSKFAITGVNGTSPVATISAQDTNKNAIYIDPTNNSIQNVKNATLTIGGNTTGNIVLSPLNGAAGSLLTVNAITETLSGTTTITASSLATFTTAASLGVTATTLTLGNGSAATIATTTNGLTLDSGSNTLTIASSDTTLTASGITTVTLGTSAVINAGATALNLQADGVPDVNIAGGSGTTGCTIANATGNLVCSGTMTSTGASGTLGYWNQTSGALFPGNSTVDLLVGATSTTSSKFSVTGVNGTSPVASVSAQNANANAIYIDPANMAIQGVKNQTLTIGGANTGNIVLSPNNGTAGIISDNAPTINTNATTLTLYDTTATTLNFARAATTINMGASTGTLALGNGGAYTIGTVSNDDLTITPNGTGNLVLTGDFDTQVLIGATSASTEFPLYINNSIGSNASLAINNINGADLLTASASGVTKFTVSNAGAASMSGSLTMIGANSIQTTSNATLTLGGNTTGNIVLSPLNGAAGSLLTVNAITETLSGTTTITASSLATFTTAASLAMSSTTTLTLGSNATINGGSAANDDLTLQGTSNGTRTTSYVLLQPTAGNVGIGDTSPLSLLTVGSGDLFQVDSSGNIFGTTLALGDGTIALTDRLFDINDTNFAISNATTYTGTVQRTLTGTLTANTTSYGLYNFLSVDATDDKFSHSARALISFATLQDGNTVDSMYGGFFQSNNASTTLSADVGITATLSAGLYATVLNSGNNSVITSNYAAETEAINRGDKAVVTTQIGLYGRSYINSNGTGVGDEAYVTNSFGVRGESFENINMAGGAGITTGYGGYFTSQDATSSAGVFALGSQNSALTETFTNVFGVRAQCQDNSSTVTITNCYGFYAEILGTLGTITNAYGIYVVNTTTAGTVTTNHGLFIADQTGGDTSDYGITIAGADTFALWISSAVDTTDAANGIAFGLSQDTNLYRSAANTLKTDDSFTIGGTTLTGSSLTLITGGATAIDFTEFDVSASTGEITINDGGNAGKITIEGTVLDIDSLTFVGAGTLTTAAGSALTINSGTTGTINIGTDASAETINIGNTGAAAKTVLIGNSAQTNTITIGNASATLVSITENNWSITTGGAIDIDSTLTVGSTASVSGNLNLAGAARTIQTTAMNSLTIGGSTTGFITINSGSSKIIISDAVSATSTLTVSSTLTASATLDAKGAVTLGDNGDDIAINSNDWDIDSNGNFTSANSIAFTSSGANIWTIGESGKATCGSAISTGVFCWELNNTIEMSLSQTGVLRTTSSQIANTTPDYAEQIRVSDESIEAGDILTSDTYDKNEENIYQRANASKSTTKYQSNIIGAVSSDPGILISSQAIDKPELASNERPLTVAGRIPLKVSTINGEVKTGDSITSSDIPGIGMKATRAGPTIGVAMTDYDVGGVNNSSKLIDGVWHNRDGPCQTDETGCYNYEKILVFISPSWRDPDVQLASSGDLTIAPTVDYNFEIRRNGESFVRIGAFSEVVSAKIRAGIIEAKETTTYALHATTATIGELSANSLAVATDNITIAGQSIQDFITGIVDARLASKGVAFRSYGGNEISANILSPLSEQEDGKISVKLNDNTGKSKLEIKNASNSAVATFDSSGNASFAGKLTTGELEAGSATISGTLHARTIVADDIVLSEDALIKLGASISAVASPSATPYQISENQSSISGNLTASTLTVTSGLMSFGPTSFFEASIADRLFVGSQLSLADNAINVLGSNLEIQPLKQGGVRFLSGLVEIDQEGNLKVEGNAYFAKDVEVKGKLSANIIAPIPGKDLVFDIASSGQGLASSSPELRINNSSHSAILTINNLGDINSSGSGTFSKLNLNFVPEALALSPSQVLATGSAGTAFIKANYYELTILNELVTEKSLIYLTPVGQTQNQIFLLRQTPEDTNLPGIQGSFTVGINQPVRVDTKFNYLIIN